MRVRHKRTREIEDAQVEVHYTVSTSEDVYELDEFADEFELVAAAPAELALWGRARRWFNRTHKAPASDLEPVKLRLLAFRARRAA